jgi:hypothetical protein
MKLRVRDRRAYIEGVGERSAEENIWTEEKVKRAWGKLNNGEFHNLQKYYYGRQIKEGKMGEI